MQNKHPSTRTRSYPNQPTASLKEQTDIFIPQVCQNATQCPTTNSHPIMDTTFCLQNIS